MLSFIKRNYEKLTVPLSCLLAVLWNLNCIRITYNGDSMTGSASGMLRGNSELLVFFRFVPSAKYFNHVILILNAFMIIWTVFRLLCNKKIPGMLLISPVSFALGTLGIILLAHRQMPFLHPGLSFLGIVMFAIALIELGLILISLFKRKAK